MKLDLVCTISPKGGFLGSMAASLVKIPRRIHFFTGQVWVNKKGPWKMILMFLDYLIGIFSSLCIADSPSQRQYLIDKRIIKERKITVLGKGSVAGVDIKKFKPDKSLRKETRHELGINEESKVMIFLGRINKDKGVNELIQAFMEISPIYDNLFLLIVGPDDGEREKLEGIVGSEETNKIFFTGSTNEPQKYLSASDILCLPSYREGFGMVIIEAASVGLPSIGSDIYGIRDAIVNDGTGLLHKPFSVEDLREKLKILLDNEELTKKLGQNARKRAIEEFRMEVMVGHFKDLEIIGELLYSKYL